MIELDIVTAVAIYLFISVISVLLLWFFLNRKSGYVIYSNERDVFWRCEICFYDYIDSKGLEISLCPQCGSYNRRKEDQL